NAIELEGELGKSYRLQALAALHINERRGQVHELCRKAIDHGDHRFINHLIISVVASMAGDKTGAQSSLAIAEEHWPDEFEELGYVVSQDGPMIWLDSATFYGRLRQRAQKLIEDAD
ncbi:MAG: hypothetical protein ACYTHJ_21110, partial [Planctomycetota bacterium]